MVGMVRMKAAASWLLGLAGALVLSGLLAYLVYGVLLAFGLAPDRAASIAAPTWPGFVVALFTVALWRSTQAQAEATRAMQELQARMAAADLEPLLGVRVVENLDEETGRRSPWLEVSNLGKYGVLLLGVYWLKSCAANPPEAKAVKELGKKSGFPVAIPSGATVKALNLDPLKQLFEERKDVDDLGCLALSLLHGGKSLERCYDVTKVVDEVFRVIIDLPASPRAILEGREEEDVQPKPIVHELITHGTVLKQRPCPRGMARALDAVEGA